MTRTEKLKLLKEMKEQRTRYMIIISVLLFSTIFSIVYSCMVDRENKRITDFINNYNSDVKVFYLKEDFKGGSY